MEKETKKFKYGNYELDADQLAEYLSYNANGWLDSQNYGKDSEGVRNSILDLIGRIQSGDIDSLDYAGNLHSKTDFAKNSTDKRFLGIKTGKTANTNGAAAYYLDEALKLYKKNKNSSEGKTKFSNDLLHKAFINKINAGNELDDNSIEALWYNLDQKGADGTRSRDQRLREYGKFLRDYANSEDLLKYDYTGSAFKTSDDYKNAVLKAADLADAGDYDNFVKAYAAAGGNDYTTLFHQGDISNEKTELQKAEELRRAELKAEGKTDEQIEGILQSERDTLNTKNQLDYLDATEEKDWQNYANQTFTSNASGTWDLNNYNNGKARGDAFWQGNYGNASGKNGSTGEYDKLGYFQTHKTALNAALNKIKLGLPLSNTDVGGGVAEAELASAAIYYDIKTNKNNYIQAKDGSYIIKDSIRPDGTAYRYNPTTRKLYLYHNTGKDTETLNLHFKSNWKKSRNSSNSGKFKDGGPLRILKALDGASIIKLADTKISNDKAKVKAEAEARGMTEKQYRASNRHVSIDKNDNWDLAEFDLSDYARMIGMGSDIAGLIASFTGAGTVANVGTGLVSTAANLYADATDDSVSAVDMGKGLLLNLGLSAVGFIPGGNSLKIFKSAVKLAPKVLAMYNAAGLAMNPEVQKSWGKIIHGGDASRMTVQDWKNIGASITALRSVTHVATNSYKNNKFSKMAGKTKKIVDPKVLKTELAEDAGVLKKLKASTSDRIVNAKNAAQAYLKNKTSNKYTYDANKMAAMKRYTELSSGNRLLDLLRNRGKYSDMSLWLKSLDYVPGGITNNVSSGETALNGLEGRSPLGKLPLSDPYSIRMNRAVNNLRLQKLNALRMKPTDPVKYNVTRPQGVQIPSGAKFGFGFKDGGKLKDLKKNIFKAELGADTKWFTDRYALKELIDWNKELDQSRAGENLNINPLHHLYGDLTGAYNSNKAYILNSDLVGQDLNTYYNSNYKGKSLDDYITNYNLDAEKIRKRWLRTDIKYNDTDAAEHNKKFKAMFSNRSGNTANAYDLGYSPSTEGILGSTTWMRRMDLYEKKFEDASDDEKKSRIHKIGDLGFVYKTENGNIAKVDDATLIRLGLKENPDGGLTDHNANSGDGSITKVENLEKKKPLGGALANLKKFSGLDPGLALVPLGLAANKDMLNNALSKRVSLDTYTPVTRSVRGDFSTLQYLLGLANKLENAAIRMASNISNSNNAMAAMLEGMDKATAAKALAYATYNNSVKDSEEKAWLLNKENSQMFDKTRNEDSMRIIQDFNSKLDVKSAAHPYNNVWKPFLMEQSYAWKTKLADLKKNALKLAQLKAQRNKEDALYAYKQKYNLAVQSGKLADIDAAADAYTKAAQAYDRGQGRLDQNEIYRTIGINIKDEPYRNDYTFGYPSEDLFANKNGGKLKTLKSGDKIKDDGPVRTRSKDADRFLKAIKHAADSHDKKLSRLATSYMASFKRTMGK